MGFALIACFMLPMIPPAFAEEEGVDSEPSVEGAMLGGEVVLRPVTLFSIPAGSVGAGFGPVAQYWGENFGARGTVAVHFGKNRIKGGSKEKDSSSASGSTDVKQTITQWGLELLAGIRSGRAKPHASAGISFATGRVKIGSEESDVTIENSTVALVLGLGVDFAASERLVLGLGLLRYERILDGDGSGSLSGLDSKSSDVEGYSLGLLNSLSVRYVF